MASLDQVITQVRFQLEQLSVRNAHHEFEHLCRHLTRQRICSNILPATGPVSSGGDQGRDFETFQTYIESTAIADSTFVGNVSEKPIAFSCTLQKKNLEAKISSDIGKILTSGARVDAIHYFCSSDIAISTRHELQTKVREDYLIELTIHDGQSISELLSNPDVFWIAERYLGIPSEIFPRVKDEENWYQQSLLNWRKKEQIRNYSDYYEIKTSLRYATFTEIARVDIPFWISHLENLIEVGIPQQLQRKVIYEISVASLRGLGSLIGQEDRLRFYFAYIKELNDPGELEDASILYYYCDGAFVQNLVELNISELTQWRFEIIDRIDYWLCNVKNSNIRCSLLATRGYISISIDPAIPSTPDITNALKYWWQIFEILDDAPLFPLEKFSDLITVVMNVFDDGKEFDRFTKELDVWLEKRFGGFKAAEKCIERARKFEAKGELLKALNQLHQSKIKWYAKETLYNSLTSMLQISLWYQELKLHFAAKYYSLACVSIAVNGDEQKIKELLVRAVIQAAECDYQFGAWLGFIELSELGLKSYELFSKEPEHHTSVDEFDRTLFHISMILAITKRFDSELYRLVNDVTNKWEGIRGILPEVVPLAEQSIASDDLTKLWERIEEQLSGKPFCDAGRTRNVVWRQLVLQR